MFKTYHKKEEKYWHGCPTLPIYNPQISLGQVLLHSMKGNESRIAQISDDSGICMSFAEIYRNTIRAAQNLQKRGFNSKQVFGLMAKNSQHIASIMFASFCLGCPVNPLDPAFTKSEVIHMLKTTKPTLMFCDIEAYDLVRDCLIELENFAKIFKFGGSKCDSEPVENLFSETYMEEDFVPVEVVGTDEVVVILCSSGTAGPPKGVCLSHAAVLEACFYIGCDDVMLSFSSLYWMSGLYTLLRGTIYSAKRIITTASFTPELQLHLIKKYKVTVSINMPHHLNLMTKSQNFHKTDLSSLKYQMCAGSKVPMHVQMEMNKVLTNGKVYVVYGLSEVAGRVSSSFPESNERNSVGQLLNGCCVKIIDDDGNRLGPNEDGEICIKMIYKFLGYYGNKKASDELYDEEGFLQTGDIGHFDDDGYLYIIDRKKELIKFNNIHISPSEIDAYLIESPEIESACVVGIPDDPNDLPAAVIVRANGSKIAPQEVYDLVAAHFADHNKLRGGVYFVDSLPTSPNGKVLRRKVTEMAIQLWNANKAKSD